MRRLLALAVVVAGIGIVVPTTAPAAGSCLALTETRNSWHRLPLPATGALVAADADNPCTLSAATGDGHTWRSADGGATWQSAGRTPGPVRAVFRNGLTSDVVLALPAGAGLYVSRDNGGSWSEATGLSDVEVAAVSTEPDNRSGVWAAGAHAGLAGSTAPTGSVFSSSDGGSTWSEDARGLPIHPDVVARLGSPYNAVFADDRNTDQLWKRDDTGAFTPSYQDAVHGLAVSPLKGGGTELYVAGDTGLVVTRDGGSAYSTMSKRSATGVAAEYNHYTAFLMLSGGTVWRSTNGGRSMRPLQSGLPGSCDGRDLRGDHGDPSTFLLTCADGVVYRYRSDGSDLSDTDTVSADTTGSGIDLGSLTPQPMQRLAVRTLPHGKGKSASIAFDGTSLYYATTGEIGSVYRVDARTGRAEPDLRLPSVRNSIVALTYDSKHHRLYVRDDAYQMWELDLRAGRLRHLFTGPYEYGCDSTCTLTGSVTYDAASDEFVFTDDQSTSPSFYDRSGHLRRTCSVTPPGIDGSALAAVVATGDGGLYGEAEDDISVYRMDAACHVTAVFTHDQVSEAPDENDALACDTTTFSEPAVWIRDADTAQATAYAVPDGYCALATTMSVTAPASVSTGSAGTVCARLRRLGTGAPIARNPVQLFVANRLIGSVPTDLSGLACAGYRPTAAEAGRGPTSAATAATHARQPVVATFLGTKAYRPAAARVVLAALDPGAAAIPPPAVAPPPPAQVPPAGPAAVAAPPAIAAPPAPPAPPAGQPQPLPQAHPGAQPGAQAMSQPGAAAQDQEEAQAATANISRHEFRGRPAPVTAPDLRVVLPVAGVLAAAVARRRRSSRVRSQVT